MTAIQQEIWAASVPVLFTLAKSPAQPGAPSSPSPPQKSPRNSPKPFSKPSSPAIGSSSPKLNSPQPPQSENFAQDTETSAQLPYAVNIPRLSYLPLLLPKLSAFFGRKLSSFSYEGIELRPLPVGLLVDLYGPELPWRIEVGEGFGGGVRGVKELEDAWMNSVKEADHLRNGTAKAILSLSREHTTSLFHSILDSDLSTYLQIHNRLLNSSNPLRHIPLRVFIPSPDISSPPTSPQPDTSTSTPKNVHSTKTGSFKVVQMLVPARGAAREATTVGMALNSMLPGLFPSRRDCIHAVVILHGVRLPMSAPLEGVMREGAYSDGWVMGVVVMLR